jgi:hypothetical protein
MRPFFLKPVLNPRHDLRGKCDRRGNGIRVRFSLLLRRPLVFILSCPHGCCLVGRGRGWWGRLLNPRGRRDRQRNSPGRSMDAYRRRRFAFGCKNGVRIHPCRFRLRQVPSPLWSWQATPFPDTQTSTARQFRRQQRPHAPLLALYGRQSRRA